MRHCAPKSIIGFGMAHKIIPLAVRRKAGSVHSSFHICRVRSNVYRTNTYIDAYTTHAICITKQTITAILIAQSNQDREEKKKERNNSKSIYFGYLWSNTFKQLNNNWSGFVVVCVVCGPGRCHCHHRWLCVCVCKRQNQEKLRRMDNTGHTQWTKNKNRRY